MKKWFYTDKIGQLYEEIVLVHGNEPILFVCLDEKKQRYLCMAYEAMMLEYVIAPISTEVLIKMLENEIPMDRAFRNNGTIYRTQGNENEKSNIDLILTAYSSYGFNADDLPQAGEYYELHFSWVKKYITQLKKELNKTNVKFSLGYSIPFSN